MLILPVSSPDKYQFFAEIQIFLRNFSFLSDWTKPLRGSVSSDLIYNVKALNLFIAPDVFHPMLLLKCPNGGYKELSSLSKGYYKWKTSDSE
jgi:hypothetical protein